MEIIPNRGIGNIYFGMSAAEVKAIMGEELVWEMWMGANLNGELYYPGIVICLIPHCTGEVIEIWLSEDFKPTYKGIPLFDLDREAIQQFLQREELLWKFSGDDDVSGIYVEAYRWEFAFDKHRLVQITLFTPA